MKTIPINQFYDFTDQLEENGYKIAITKNRTRLGDFNDYIAYNHDTKSFITFTFSTIKDRLSYYDGFKIKEYTLKTLPKKYFEFIY